MNSFRRFVFVILVAVAALVGSITGFRKSFGGYRIASSNVGTNSFVKSLEAKKPGSGSESPHFLANAQYRHDLLSSADEFALSRQHKLGLNIQVQSQALAEELGREATYEELSEVLLVPAGQLKSLIEKADFAKRKLVAANMRLVLHIAKYYRFRGISYPDLVQEGTFGLIKAVDKYDPDRGFRFSTYASWWIKQAISRAVAEKSRIVRLPVHIHDLMVSLSRVEKTFVAMNGRKPTTHELAHRLALPIQKVELLIKSKREVSSIDEDAFSGQNGKDGGGSGVNEVQVKDRIASESLEPSSNNENLYLRNELRRSMKTLSEREIQILEMRFGLVDGTAKTLEEIGKEFSVTRERVRQIEARALSKLRHPEMANELKEIFQDHSFILTPELEIAPEAIMEKTAPPTSSSVETKAEELVYLASF